LHSIVLTSMRARDDNLAEHGGADFVDNRWAANDAGSAPTDLLISC